MPERGSVISGPRELTQSMGVFSQLGGEDGLRIGTAAAAPMDSLNPRDSYNKKESEISKNLEVLGFVGYNKELFLFEKPVTMVDGVEKWLVEVEKSMHDTISKMLGYAVSSFPTKPLDEWVLDYPQQIILTTLHLIFSHEVNEILEGTLVPTQEDLQEEEKDKSPIGSTLEIPN